MPQCFDGWGSSYLEFEVSLGYKARLGLKKEKQNNNGIEKSKLRLADTVHPVSANVAARPQLMYQPPACSFHRCSLNTCVCPHTQSLLWITWHIMSYDVFFLGRFCIPDHSSSCPVRTSSSVCIASLSPLTPIFSVVDTTPSRGQSHHYYMDCHFSLLSL